MRSLLAVFALAAVLPAQAARVEVRPDTARISRVTVYVDRAEVVREARLTLGAGDTEVVVAGIPEGIETDSIRVRAHGTPATLGAVQVRDEVRKTEERVEAGPAERELRRLRGEIASLEGEAAVDAELQAFLASMKAVSTKTTSEDLGRGKVDPQSLQDMYALVHTSLSDLKRRELQRAERRRDLNDQLAVAEAALAAARPPASNRSRVATVDVHAEAGGALTLELVYVVPGTGWRPHYRATLDPDGDRVELVREAVVAQTTGEDWSDVALTLSTALPSRGVEPPAVAPWILRAVVPGADSIDEVAVAGATVHDLPVRGRFYQNVLTMAPGVADARVAEGDPLQGGFLRADQAKNAAVEIVETAYDVSFLVPTATDVPADGREHRVVLQRTALPVTLGYFVAPRVRAAAFLTATARLPEGAPLLRGPVRISNGTAYLGTFLVGETAPGAELRLPFGEDARVKVTRVALPEERSREGFGDRMHHTVSSFRTRLENLRGNAVTVRVEEAVPVSEDERVKVELARSTSAGSREDPDRPGVRRWEVTLAPREVRDLEIGYDVRWPKEVVLASR